MRRRHVPERRQCDGVRRVRARRSLRGGRERGASVRRRHVRRLSGGLGGINTRHQPDHCRRLRSLPGGARVRDWRGCADRVRGGQLRGCGGGSVLALRRRHLPAVFGAVVVRRVPAGLGVCRGRDGSSGVLGGLVRRDNRHSSVHAMRRRQISGAYRPHQLRHLYAGILLLRGVGGAAAMPRWHATEHKRGGDEERRRLRHVPSG